METKPYVIGNQIDFCREGDTLDSANPASRTEAPATSDTAWIDLGVIDNVGIVRNPNFRDIKTNNAGGPKILYDKIPIEEMLGFNFVLEEMSPLVMEYLYGVAEALDDASTTFALLNSKDYRGWFRIKQYDQNKTLFNTVLAYVFVNVSGTTDMNLETKITFDADVLYSTLNSGTLADNS